MIRVGCDIVHIARFAQTTASQPAVLEKIFTPHELAYAQRVEQLAGIFAAKESIIKALGTPPPSWHDIEIGHEPSGRPLARIANTTFLIAHIDVSISHDGDYALACAVVELA